MALLTAMVFVVAAGVFCMLGAAANVGYYVAWSAVIHMLSAGSAVLTALSILGGAFVLAGQYVKCREETDKVSMRNCLPKYKYFRICLTAVCTGLAFQGLFCFLIAGYASLPGMNMAMNLIAAFLAVSLILLWQTVHAWKDFANCK